MSDTMRAICCHAWGNVSSLELAAMEMPKPGPGEVLVKVFAAGVNPVDWKIVEGMGQAMGLTLPHIPGCEIAGTIHTELEPLEGFPVGARVYGYISLRRCGGFADYAVARIDELAHIPDDLTFEEAAALPVGALTSWQALLDAAKLDAGQRVLIHGASGGVGSMAVQIAKAKGAYVIGTASARNEVFVRSLGADEFVDYTAQPFEEAVQAVDVVLDTIGGDTQERSYQVINEGGYLVSIVSPPSTELGAEHQVDVSMTAVQPSGAQLEMIGKLVRGGQLRLHIDDTFPLERAVEALEKNREGRTRGKIVVVP